MVISEEFDQWGESSRRIDLLCIDKEANLVVVELKRTEDGGHMELQAIRYAAKISAVTFSQLVDVHGQYLEKGCRRPSITPGAPRPRRRQRFNHLRWRRSKARAVDLALRLGIGFLARRLGCLAALPGAFRDALRLGLRPASTSSAAVGLAVQRKTEFTIGVRTNVGS